MKKIKLYTLSTTVVGLLALFTPTMAQSADYMERTISYLGAGDQRPCVFFTLNGVATADAAMPGSPWFVLPKTHPQFRESYALLLSAKLTGQKLNVVTTGVLDSCGHAQVASIGLP